MCRHSTNLLIFHYTTWRQHNFLQDAVINKDLVDNSNDIKYTNDSLKCMQILLKSRFSCKSIQPRGKQKIENKRKTNPLTSTGQVVMPLERAAQLFPDNGYLLQPAPACSFQQQLASYQSSTRVTKGLQNWNSPACRNKWDLQVTALKYVSLTLIAGNIMQCVSALPAHPENRTRLPAENAAEHAWPRPSLKHP